MTVRAPAKVNLHLSVGRRRADGFHDLTTVFHAVGLYDEVVLSRADAPSVSLVGEGIGEVPLDGDNLALRAVALLAQETGEDPGVEVLIDKGIPVAGGMAGGSADAAAALVGCDALWGTGLSREALEQVGSRLGSDVPFSLHGGTALGTGRGEQLTPVLAHGHYSWVVALVEGGLSTADVYRELDHQRAVGPVTVVGDPAEVLTALRSGDPQLLGAALSNDLQAAAVALMPSLQGLLDAALALGALGAVVSGSGPTVVALARDDSHAVALAAALAAHPSCRAVRRADGPVPGARVVA